MMDSVRSTVADIARRATPTAADLAADARVVGYSRTGGICVALSVLAGDETDAALMGRVRLAFLGVPMPGIQCVQNYRSTLNDVDAKLALLRDETDAERILREHSYAGRVAPHEATDGER